MVEMSIELVYGFPHFDINPLVDCHYRSENRINESILPCCLAFVLAVQN